MAALNGRGKAGEHGVVVFLAADEHLAPSIGVLRTETRLIFFNETEIKVTGWPHMNNYLSTILYVEH